MTTPARNAVARLIEDTGADAVVVLYTVVRRGRTEACTYSWGNVLACQKLIEQAQADLHDQDEEATS